MSVLIAPESEEAKERVKWEAHPTMMGMGKRPYVYREYPMMVHKAGRPANGLGPHCIVEQRIAADEKDRENWAHEGFCATPLEAIAYLEAQGLEIAKLAAEINYDQKHKLSEGANAEVDAARAQHRGHMPMVPETPIKPRGRKPRTVKEK